MNLLDKYRSLSICAGLGCAVLAVSSIASGADKRCVTRADVNDTFVGVTILQDDPLAQEKVEYLVIGKSNYDEFFRSSAKLHAGMVISQSATSALTTHLKGYARSYAAAQAADQSVKEIVGNSKPEDLTNDQAVALLALKKKHGELTADELSFATNSVASAAVLTKFLYDTPGQASGLVSQGTALTSSVPSDFKGFELLKVPDVVAGLNKSLSSLQAAVEKAPDLAKRLARLSEGLKSLL
jgi:hypothetical protein